MHSIYPIKPGLVEARSGRTNSLSEHDLPEQQVLDPTQLPEKFSPWIEAFSSGMTSRTSVLTQQPVLLLVHEMRNAICVILNVLKACQKAQRSTIEQQHLMLALGETERLNRMTTEILAQSRCENHSIWIRQEIKFADLIQEVIDLSKELPVAVDRHLALESNIPDVVVMGDRDKLKQAFLNLLINAYEAIDLGQSIVIQFQSDLNAHQVSTKIHNGGKPIPHDLLSHLGQKPLTTKSFGNGIGLMITKKIVTIHDGEMSITSSNLTGTTVCIYLPTSD